MRTETEKAKQVLERDNRTLVLCSENEIITSGERGVKTLLALEDEGRDLSAFCAADKVVGKGAAVLFALLKVKELYAAVISEKAKKLLCDNGITVYSGQVVPAVLNRKGDGFCPIETAVGNTENLQQALEIIKDTLEKMRAK